MVVRDGYSYDDLTKNQKLYVDGMIAAKDQLEYVSYIDMPEGILEKLQDEISQEVIELASEELTSLIAETIISFTDQNAEAVCEMPRKLAEKKYGKRFVAEVLG